MCHAWLRRSCLGGQTIRDAQRVYADVFVLGTCGIDSEIGITSLDAEEAELKRCMIEQSGRIVVPATTDKIGTVAPYKVADCSKIDVLVVQTTVSASLIARFEADGMRVEAASWEIGSYRIISKADWVRHFVGPYPE
ncbi:hypothetical protein ABFT80_27655 [Mesorhizobium sp. SB112]|uniref:hypothetical protein n=1 Tax=Mesorhizobium sp. SB112 TaxID=3151853 RepID=UPI003262DD10